MDKQQKLQIRQELLLDCYLVAYCHYCIHQKE